MRDAGYLVNLIKRIALGAVATTYPTAIQFGKVTSVSPLKINVEQKMTLSKEHLILTRNVKDYKSKVTVNWSTESTDNHTHQIQGVKEITFHNALEIGDNVLMLRMQGDQKFIVWHKL
ncbi:DUF2577 domain-containing protein [Tepidibacillus decaturensis]|uniref:DUF2577 domain-containing protein n=1 Tax=Tepidibacillus decaturensis TaxID=1413211 RepID=A0A135L171_9BACI|nr:DUF2577 domain-containing protein [Tepidibacillus decaturensis]KXG42663.1 hypothetical protein U473_00325 [Tepidibacillus decaturensis]